MAKQKQKDGEEKSNSPSWLEVLQNPRGLAIKRFMFQVLGERYAPHDDLIARLTTCLVTDGDMTAFNKLVNDIYDIGFNKAVTEYAEQIKKLDIPLIIKKTQAGNG